MCHPCMVYSRCRSEVFRPWLTAELCLILYWAVELHCFFFKPSELFLQGKPDPGFGFPSVFCQAELHGRYCRCIDVYLILVCGMLVFSYVCIYFFPYWLKKAHTFQELELIVFEKIGEVKELQHWLLSPESQDTIQGLMNCTLFLLCF